MCEEPKNIPVTVARNITERILCWSISVCFVVVSQVIKLNFGPEDARGAYKQPRVHTKY